MANKHANKFYYVKIDVDEADEIAIECKATSLPTFQIYNNGKMIKKLTSPDMDSLTQLFQE